MVSYCLGRIGILYFLGYFGQKADMAKRQRRNVSTKITENLIMDAFAGGISPKRTSRNIPELRYCAYPPTFVIFNVCKKCLFKDSLRGVRCKHAGYILKIELPIC